MAFLLLCGVAGQAAVVWQEDFEAARQQAALTGKPLYLAFLGSDWSVASRDWQERVLEAEVFQTFADAHLVLFRLDAIRDSRDKARMARQQALVIAFDIESYPTLILLDADGEERLRHGRLDLEAAVYVESLRTLLEGDQP